MVTSCVFEPPILHSRLPLPVCSAAGSGCPLPTCIYCNANGTPRGDGNSNDNPRGIGSRINSQWSRVTGHGGGESHSEKVVLKAMEMVKLPPHPTPCYIEEPTRNVGMHAFVASMSRSACRPRLWGAISGEFQIMIFINPLRSIILLSQRYSVTHSSHGPLMGMHGIQQTMMQWLPSHPMASGTCYHMVLEPKHHVSQIHHADCRSTARTSVL